MKKSVLSSAIAGAMLATSSVAIAQNTGASPELTLPEKGAFTCIEQSLSLVAALIDRQGCAASLGNYTLSGDILFDGSGFCTVDDTTVGVLTQNDTMRGTYQTTAIAGVGEIDDVDFTNLRGEFWYSGEGEIMYADAYFQLCLVNCGVDLPGAENYDEHVIKDFYMDPNPTERGERVVLDQGLEVITKNNWPRKKYRQTSEYVPPDGGLGYVEIDKVSIAPSNAPECYIILDAEVDDFGGGIQWSGSLDVLPLI